MFSKLDNRNNTHLTSIAIFLIALMVLLNSGKDFLHNHDFDEKKNDDCRVLILNQVMSTGLISEPNINVENKVDCFNITSDVQLFIHSKIQSISLRAPPIS